MQINIEAVWYDKAIQMLKENKDVKNLENKVFQDKTISMTMSITCNNIDDSGVINLIILG